MKRDILSIREAVPPVIQVVNSNDSASRETLAPVSYTHLDVYKRQGVLHARLTGNRESRRNGKADVGHLGEVRALAAERRLHGGVAVSYTHLHPSRTARTWRTPAAH